FAIDLTSPRVRSIFFRVAALLLSFRNVDPRRDPVRSLFPVGYLQRGTAFSGEALNGLFRAGNLGLVIVSERHLWLVAGSFDAYDFLCCINFRKRSGEGLIRLWRLAGYRQGNEEQHSKGCT